MNTQATKRIGRIPAALAVAAAIAVGACDVQNPGRVLDEDLNQQSAMRIVVNGMGGDMTLAHRHFGWNMNVFTGDMSGTSAYKSRIRHWRGNPQDEDAEDYNSLRAVVAIHDNALQRINEVLGSEVETSPLAAEAYMWAGFGNRYAGDAFCQAVVDGGPPQSRELYHERAIERFSRAIEIASAAGPDAQDVLYAAYGGRAHSSMQLGDWSGAVSDAQQVPDDFVFTIKMDAASEREWNEIYYENQQRVNLNVRWTWFDWYAQNYDDPRVRTFSREDISAADGSGLQLMHRKFPSRSADIPAVHGAEMRLIEAEHLITQQGDWQAGLDIVNQVRTDAGMDPWEATNQEEAFEALKKERAIVLWLESRRGGDLWRWGNTAAGDPILAKMYELTPPPAQYPGGAGGLTIPQSQREICMPFSITVKSTNNNIGG